MKAIRNNKYFFIIYFKRIILHFNLENSIKPERNKSKRRCRTKDEF